MNLFDIGTNLKKLRKEKGLSQEALSKKAGISRVTLGKIERGELGLTSVKSLDIILSTLGYEINFIQKRGFGIPNLDELKK